MATEIKHSLLALVGDYPHLTELLHAFARHCVCRFDAYGDLIGQPCSSCQLLSDPISIRRLQFGRALAIQSQGEEFNVTEPAGPEFDVEPEPHMTSEYAWDVLRRMEDAA